MIGEAVRQEASAETGAEDLLNRETALQDRHATEELHTGNAPLADAIPEAICVAVVDPAPKATATKTDGVAETDLEATIDHEESTDGVTAGVAEAALEPSMSSRKMQEVQKPTGMVANEGDLPVKTRRIKKSSRQTTRITMMTTAGTER
ncbi:MAG: hypothetical protein AAF355_08645 [Myxococcota bacterium]